MMRMIIGVIVGYVVWTAIWLTVNAMVFAEAGEVIAAGDAFTETGPLLGLLALSIACSLAGGVWSLMPVWYHLIFWALLVPVTLLGGMFVLRRQSAN